MLSKIKAKQTQLLWGSIVILGLLILFSITMLINNRPVEEKKSTKKTINTGASRVNPQEVWVHKFTAEAQLTQKRLEALEGTLDKLLKTTITEQQGRLASNGSSSEVGSLRQELSNNQNVSVGTNMLPTPPTVNDSFSCVKQKEDVSLPFVLMPYKR